MTNEQINATIAEACGWKAKGNTWLTPAGTPVFASDVPNYCNDLNAMHEAEVILSELQLGHMAREIEWRMAREIKHNETQWYFRATARQRAEAFLRTMGKWEEVQG